MGNRYQKSRGKCKGNFEVVAGRELAVRMPLPLVQVWEKLQAEVERLTGHAGCRFCKPSWRTKSRSGWDRGIGPTRPGAIGAGAASRVRGVRRAEDCARAAAGAQPGRPRS